MQHSKRSATGSVSSPQPRSSFRRRWITARFRSILADRFRFILAARYRAILASRFRSILAVRFAVAVPLAVILAGAPSPSLAATITFQTEASMPRIVSTAPAHRAINVPTTFNPIQVTFDQEMDLSTLNVTNIRLIDLSTGNAVPGWTPAAINTTATTFRTVASLGLAAGHTYALLLTTGVKSAAGKSLDPADPLHRTGTLYGEAWVLEFSTGGAVLAAAIGATNIGNIPGGSAGGQTGVPIDAIIRVTFERAMTASTLNTTNIVLKKTLSGTQVTVSVTYDPAARTVTITPASPLEYATSYTLILTGLYDITGEPLL